METADGSEAAPEAPQPTYISIHIHQESGLAKLLLAGCSLLRLPASASGTNTLSNSRLLVASWVVQIALGILSCVLGGFFGIFWSSAPWRTGAPFWTGAVALLAGVTAFFSEKHGGIWWALLRILLGLATLCSAIAAIVVTAHNFCDYYNFRSDFCDDYTSMGWLTKAPSTPDPKEDERLHLCISHLNMLKALFISLQAMVIGVWVLLLLASLVLLVSTAGEGVLLKRKRTRRRCWK
uniref:Transmembrane protein 176A n=1 Tax=Castor canadensis TaxID=51338 RepID=A0A8C0W961_CASCN